MKVRQKANAPLVKKLKKNRNKIYFNTVAVAFKNYNDALSKADLLFDAFSPERMEAQRVALDKLRQRLKDLGLLMFLHNLDFDSSYQFPIKYADVA